MTEALAQYLEDLLGQAKVRELRTALNYNKTIVVSGVNISGKTTLCNILTTYGFPAVEEDNVYRLELDKPLDSMVRNKGDIVKASMTWPRK